MIDIMYNILFVVMIFYSILIGVFQLLRLSSPFQPLVTFILHPAAWRRHRCWFEPGDGIWGLSCFGGLLKRGSGEGCNWPMGTVPASWHCVVAWI